MRRIRRRRVVRARRHNGSAPEVNNESAQDATAESPNLYRAVPGDGDDAPTVITAGVSETSQPRRRSVLP
ncbi:MAG: hypothetical protein QF554_12620, partial [Dehalococcoidia bacterium]|nr:hypothetical protein [Dehalococcoidia bacterium]